jgi:mannose-P-dolichol utilization defect protein 1
MSMTAVKVPQIVKIVRAGSAKGVSLISHLIELAVYTISVTRSFNAGHPFR